MMLVTAVQDPASRFRPDGSGAGKEYPLREQKISISGLFPYLGFGKRDTTFEKFSCS
jgi:hypothetical protein